MGGNAETNWALSAQEKVTEACRKKALRLGFNRLYTGFFLNFGQNVEF